MRLVLQKIFNAEKVIAVVSILLITIITHGIRLKELGFYYDDWYVLWSAAARGAGSLVGLFSTDRPAMGYLYYIVYRVIGDSMLGWHLYTLAWRFVGALSFFWIIRSLWPDRKFLSTLAAMLFVVYPAFLSEPDALTKINHLTGYGLALSSMALLLAAIRVQKKIYQIPLEIMALLAGSAYVWIYEYMIGLEAMRLVLLGLLFYKLGLKKFSAILKAIVWKYWPYVITISFFLFWRLFIFNSSRPATNVEGLLGDYGSNPVYMVIRIFAQTILDFLSTTVFAWFVKLYSLLAQAEFGRIAIAAIIGCVGILLVLSYRHLFTKMNLSGDDSKDNEDRRTALEMVGVGIVGTLFAILPVVISNRSINLLDAYKSYGLHPSAGAILIVMGLLELLRPKARFAVLLALLFLSMTTNSLNIDYWKTLWQMERSMWWQVAWRAPNIANDTFVMAYAPTGYLYMQDYEVWGPLNLIYRKGRNDAPSIQSEVLNVDTLLDVTSKTVSDRYVRDIYLHRDYGNLLLISQPSLNSCVHIIDGKMPAFSESERLVVKEAGIYSNINRILMDGTSPTPPPSIFGNEPAHDWCYIYQKASLARQMGDWKTILELYDTAQKDGLQPEDKSEYFPFLEAMVNSGKVNEAKILEQDRIQNDKALSFSFCSSVSKDPVYPENFQYDYKAMRKLFCGN